MDTLEGPQEGRRAGIAHGQPREATLLVNSVRTLKREEIGINARSVSYCRAGDKEATEKMSHVNKLIKQ
jgi:hypothetical protein